MPIHFAIPPSSLHDWGYKDAATTSQMRKLQAIENQRAGFVAAAEHRVANHQEEESDAIVAAYLSGVTPDDALIAAQLAVEQQGDAWKRLLVAIYIVVGTIFATRTMHAWRSSYNARPAEEVRRDIMQVIRQAGLKQDDVTTQMLAMVTAMPAKVLAYLDKMAGSKIQGINATTLRLIREALKEGVSQGEDVPTLAQRLQIEYPVLNEARAVRIAQTEVTAASNWGSLQGAMATGVPLDKIWLAILDNRTRDAHAEAHGQKQPLDQPFLVQGEQLHFPGDVSLNASASNVINCRCGLDYISRDPQ